MPTLDHVLVLPVDEGGEIVLAHAFGSGIHVWMRNLARRVDEHPRPRSAAAPLYGGNISNMPALRAFVTDFADHATDDAAVQLSPGRPIPGWRRLRARTDLTSTSSRMHFSYRALSPMHTVGDWEGAAPELLISRVRGVQSTRLGYFATGLPELRTETTLSALSTTVPAAVITREQAQHLSEYLNARAGRVLHHLGPTARR